MVNREGNVFYLKDEYIMNRCECNINITSGSLALTLSGVNGSSGIFWWKQALQIDL